jgi:hypothetical protein
MNDDEFINKPLPYYANLATIFNNSIVTGKYAKSSNEPLAVDVDENTKKAMSNIGEPETRVNEETPKPSSTNRPTKRAMIVESGLDLVGAFERDTQTLTDAIKTAAKTVVANTLSDGLFESVDTLPGFELQHKAKYYAHLVANPKSARVFINMPFEYKLSWVSAFVNENF